MDTEPCAVTVTIGEQYVSIGQYCSHFVNELVRWPPKFPRLWPLEIPHLGASQ
jgi:hypothetical protein